MNIKAEILKIVFSATKSLCEGLGVSGFFSRRTTRVL
jgi:hypothetical protein